MTTGDIGSLLGFLGAFILWLQVVFGSRHIFKIFSTDTVALHKFHKITGIYGTLLIFAHPLLEMMRGLESLLWLFIPNFSSELDAHLSFGRIALVLLLIIWISSALIREKIKWRPWKYLHLLAYPALFFVFMHAYELGTYTESYPLIKAVWTFFFVLFLIASLFRLSAFFGIFKKKYTIVRKEFNEAGDILILTLTPQAKKQEVGIGQHFFLTGGRCRSEHPFTVMEQNREDGTLIFGIKKVGGFWDTLLVKNEGDTLLLDGPYGTFTREAQNTDPKVVISGGVGITPFVDLVKFYGENTIFINCNRSEKSIIRKEEVKRSVEKYVDILDTIETELKENVYLGPLSGTIVKELVGEKVNSLPYFVCGSPFFIKIVQKNLLELGVPKEKIFFEELGF
jgi:3-phenylpropionate/trans-cinnamate dioxygenase ferredoxin reductase subunit